MLNLVSARYARNRAEWEENMHQPRLFLKMTTAEHNILNLAKSRMQASSYKEVIVSLLEGEYIDFLCSSALTEKALRKIIVNLNQLSSKTVGSSASFNELTSLINQTTAILTDWNNSHIQPVLGHNEETREIQIRVSQEEKDMAHAAKSAGGFKTYCDLVMHLCSAYITDTYNLPVAPDYTLFNDIGKALNKEVKQFNTYGVLNPDMLNNIFDTLYELITDLNKTLSEMGGNHVSQYKNK